MKQKKRAIRMRLRVRSLRMLMTRNGTNLVATMIPMMKNLIKMIQKTKTRVKMMRKKARLTIQLMSWKRNGMRP